MTLCLQHLSVVPTLVVFILPLTSGGSCLEQPIIVADYVSSFICFESLFQTAIACSIGLPKDTVSQQSVSIWNSATVNLKNVSSIFLAYFSPAHRKWVFSWHQTCTHILPSGSELQLTELQYGWTEFILRSHSSWSWQIHNAKLGMWQALIYELLMGSWCLIKCWFHRGYFIKILVLLIIYTTKWYRSDGRRLYLELGDSKSNWHLLSTIFFSVILSTLYVIVFFIPLVYYYASFW